MAAPLKKMFAFSPQGPALTDKGRRMDTDKHQKSGKKPKNLARSIPRNFCRLTKEVLKEMPMSLTDVKAVLSKLFGKIWGANLTEAQKQDDLFAFGPWEKAKMAVLDARCLPLPNEHLPKSRNELRALCRKLLDRTSGYLAHRFIAGWDGVRIGEEEEALESFSDALWATNATDPEFFNAVAAGNFGTAMRYLREQSSQGLRLSTAISLMYRMALIWSAHDVQATAARAYRSTRGPFDWLHFGKQGKGKRLTAGTIIAAWRPVYKMLTANAGNYRTNEESRSGKPETSASRHDDVKTIKEEATKSIDRSMLPEYPRAKRDALMSEVRVAAQTQDDLFFNELRKDKTPEEIGNLQLSQIWYHGLTPLQMGSLPIIALIRMETVLQTKLMEMYRSGSGRGQSLLPKLSFNEKELPKGWKTRARLLLDEIRRTIIKDADFGSQNIEKMASDGDVSHDDTWLDPTLDFMRQFASNANDTEGPGKTYRLLELCVATRLLR